MMASPFSFHFRHADDCLFDFTISACACFIAFAIGK